MATSKADPLMEALHGQEVLLEALLQAGSKLGLSQAEIGKIISLDLGDEIHRIDPDSPAGEAALKLIRCYTSLSVLVGGQIEDIQHWMHTKNSGTGGVPAEQVQTKSGLTQVLEYLERMRSKL